MTSYFNVQLLLYPYLPLRFWNFFFFIATKESSSSKCAWSKNSSNCLLLLSFRFYSVKQGWGEFGGWTICSCFAFTFIVPSMIFWAVLANLLCSQRWMIFCVWLNIGKSCALKQTICYVLILEVRWDCSWTSMYVC